MTDHDFSRPGLAPGRLILGDTLAVQSWVANLAPYCLIALRLGLVLKLGRGQRKLGDVVMPMLLKMTFIAWLDKATGKKPRLIVTGKAETPTSGWSGTLVRAPLQGAAPQILLLDARLTKPTGPTNPRIGQIDLRYEEMPTGGYTQVIVRLNGTEVTLRVEGAE